MRGGNIKTVIQEQSVLSFLAPGSDFPGGSDGTISAYNVETWGSALGWKDPLEKEMAT